LKKIRERNLKMLGNSLKCLMLGIAIGTAATIAIASCTNIKEKIQNTTEKSCDNISTMFKLK
jgi:hypothetical protein